jgi:uncharacterized protein YcbK (DUF882 family)
MHQAEPLTSDKGPLLPERRKFLTTSASLLGSSLVMPAWGQTDQSFSNDFWVRPRTIRLKHVTGEIITSTYWSDGELIISEYVNISWFMRDRVAGKAVYMNPVLLDIVYGVCGWLDYFGLHKPVVLTSGHRDRERNRQIEGAAKDSLHITGDAGDIRIPDVNPLQVAKFGAWLGGGGVGWYPSKGFTHLDRGRLRTWKG